MNYLLKLSVAICLLFSVSSCSVDSLEDSTDERAINTTAVTPNVACSNQDPKSKLINTELSFLHYKSSIQTTI